MTDLKPRPFSGYSHKDVEEFKKSCTDNGDILLDEYGQYICCSRYSPKVVAKMKQERLIAEREQKRENRVNKMINFWNNLFTEVQ